MKKILFVLILCSIIFTACNSSLVELTPTAANTIVPIYTTTPTASPTITSTSTPTLIPSPTPCVNIVSHPKNAPDSTVNYYGCTAYLQTDLDPAFEQILLWSPKEVSLGQVSVEVYDDVIDLVRWEIEHGANASEKDLENGWKYGARGKAYEKYNTVVIYIQPESSWSVGERVKDLSHELQHLIQAAWLGGKFNKPLPVIVIEGGAEWRARKQEAALGYTPLDTAPSLGVCSYTYEHLVNVPQDGDNEGCWYVEGEQMFILLEHLYGDRYDVLWSHIKTSSFESAFKQTYGVSIAEFVKMFDEFVSNGYILP